MNNNVLRPISQAHKIQVPFVSAEFGGAEFGLMTRKKNPITGVINSDFITSLTVQKYGSGAVNQYDLQMVYVITPECDPNYVDMIISRASDREIYFTYGDLSEPKYSYKKEKGIITGIVPNIDYKKNTITYNIKATSSTNLNYALKKNFEATTMKPSLKILEVLYNSGNGIIDLLSGMANRDEVLANGWIPQNDQVVRISEKKNIAPLDYILYLVSLMKGTGGEYYFLKVFDSIDSQKVPHFEIVSTKSKERGKRLSITVGYPGSIPVYDLKVNQSSSTALLVDYKDKIEPGLHQDYGFRGDLITQNYYSSEVVDGNPSQNMKNWWEKMLSFPISANLTTDGLYLPAEIVQSINLDMYFFGKRYNHSGEFLIMDQTDQINMSGYRTSLGLLRIAEGE